jgi:predicted nucleic acid-binding protein
MSQFYSFFTDFSDKLLVIPEIAAAIGHGQSKPDLGYLFAVEVSRFPNVTLVNLDKSLAETAAEIAATYRLRGSDAVYAAVAALPPIWLRWIRNNCNA